MESSNDSAAGIATTVGFDSPSAALLRKLYGRRAFTTQLPVPQARTVRQLTVATMTVNTATTRHAMLAYDTVRKEEAAETRLRAREMAAERASKLQHLASASKRRPQIASTYEPPNEDAWVPPISKGRNTDAEKYKLQSIFEFGGGAALPQCALAASSGRVPLALLLQPNKRCSSRRLLRKDAVGAPVVGQWGQSLQ